MSNKEYGGPAGGHEALPPKLLQGAAGARRLSRLVTEGFIAVRRDSGGVLPPFGADDARVRELHPPAAPNANDGDRLGAFADRSREALKDALALDRELAAAESSASRTESLARLRKHIHELAEVLAGLTSLAEREAAARPGPQSFDVEPADGSQAIRVTPPLESATLDVASPAHGRVRVPVLARFFPAHTVHASRSTAVVAASHCRLKAIDHYHVHRVTVGFDEVLREGRAALRDLFKDRTDAGIARFQKAMKRIADRPEHADTRASLPIRQNPHTLITSSKAVQLGDGSRMNVITDYVVEESRLPVTDLLARDKDLVRSFLAAVDGPERGPATRKFLSDALRRVGRADDLAVLSHGSGLSTPDTSIRWIFGVDSVAWASAVMVGRDNDLLTSMRVERDSLSPARIRSNLARIRAQAPRLVPDPATTAEGSARHINRGVDPPGALPPLSGLSLRGPRPPQRRGRRGRGGPW